jgi:hypothetical protein
MIMEKQFNAQQEISHCDEILRELLDGEVVLIGGGESASHIY